MSGGYCYGEPEPKAPCPYCGTWCHADFVDIGVGMQQCGPYHCDACGASEIGTFDDDRPLTPEEQRTGWYAPGAPPGSSANLIAGKHVPHEEMLRVYRSAFIGNPLWRDEKAVDDWWRNTRAKPTAQ